MTTKITAGAFLICGDKVLLMKRGLHKKLAPGLWAGIGGHLDMEDIKDPRAIDIIETFYREVWEEANIAKTDIKNLQLRYIVVSKLENQISWHYHYFGELENEITPLKCAEGEFHWVDRKGIIDLPMSATVLEAIKHWLTHPDESKVFLIVCNVAEEKITILDL